MKWFKHDSTSNMDSKLQDVILEYGAEGYGLYWYCLELIASNVEADKMTFELEHDARIIGRNLGLGVQRVEEMMKHMVNIGLFESSQGMITCMKLAKRADDYTSKLVKQISPQAVESVDIAPSPTNSDKNSLDKIRLNKNITNKKASRFQPPTIEELADYIQEKGYSVDPDRFWHFYNAKGWMVGRNKMKSWKSALATWKPNRGNYEAHHGTPKNAAEAAAQLRASIAAREAASRPDGAIVGQVD